MTKFTQFSSFALLVLVAIAPQVVAQAITGGTVVRVDIRGDNPNPQSSSAPFGQIVSLSSSSILNGAIGSGSATGLSVLNLNQRSGSSRFAVQQSTGTPNSGAFGVEVSGESVIEFTTTNSGTFFARGGKPSNPFGSLLVFTPFVREQDGTYRLLTDAFFGTDAIIATGSFSYESNRAYRVLLGTSISYVGHSNTSATTGVWNWGLDSLPGTTPANPILPVGNIGSTFDIAIGSVSPNNVTFIDPVFAEGYDYTSTDRNIRSVLIPSALPGGDNSFELTFEGQTVTLIAGTAFDFTTLVPAGVGSFSIRGIDRGAGLDPSDPTAFVTGLTFVSEGSTNVLMTPFVTIPEPSSLWMAAAGVMTVLLTARHHRRAAEPLSGHHN